MGRGRQLWNKHRSSLWVLDPAFSPKDVLVCVEERYVYSQFILVNLKTNKKIFSKDYTYTSDKRMKTTGTVNYIKKKAEYASISTSWLALIDIEVSESDRRDLISKRIDYRYSEPPQEKRKEEKKAGMWVVILGDGTDIIPCRTEAEAQRRQKRLGEGIIQFGKYWFYNEY